MKLIYLASPPPPPRWNKSAEWKSNVAELDWKEIVEPIMRSYTEATDGSSIEIKESALVWHHQYADPDFGSWQAMELMDHLENVLANEPVVVTRGQLIVEVKPQVTASAWFPHFYDTESPPQPHMS